MSASILTNRSALQALRAVNQAGEDLAATRSRISTGLKVAGPKDDGAVFAIAQGMRAQVAGWGVINGALARAQSGLDVASAGSEGISDLLRELQQRAVAFGDAPHGRARAAIRGDMEALVRQIDQMAGSAVFDGVGLLTGRPSIHTQTTTAYWLPASTLTPPGFAITMAALPPGAAAYTAQISTPALPHSPLTPASFEAALATISGSESQTVAVDAGPAAGRVSLLLDAYGVPDIAEIWQDGVRVAATGQAWAAGGTPVGPGAPVSGAHVLSFDYDPANGQTLEFRFNETVPASGTAWTVGGLVLGDPGDPPPAPVASIRNTTQVRMSAAFDPPLAEADPEQVARATGERPANPTAEFQVDGGPVPGRVDMLFDAFDLPDRAEVFQGGVRVAASGQAYAPGGAAVGPPSPVPGQQVISFDYDPARGPITFRFNDGGADPDSAWVVGALSLQPHGAPLPAPQTSGSSHQTPGFSPVDYDFPSSLDGGAIRVSSRDLTARGLGLDPMDWDDPAWVLGAVRAAGATAAEAAVYFGQRGKLVAGARAQITRLGDTLESGLGALVDADLARESARLQAQQVRQQLAAQTMAVANARPQWLLSLFRK